MFSKIPSFFSMPNISAPSAESATMFAGMPLVNPLLNDAQQNIDSLDERINQLESVAQWLNLNLQMVNSSVQQLQVQKQTLQALAQWQAISKETIGELAKINPFASSSTEAEDKPSPLLTEKRSARAKARSSAQQTATPKTTETSTKAKIAQKPKLEESKPTPELNGTNEESMPAAFEKMAQTWWDGLQNQFAQLAQPMLSTLETQVDNGEKNEPVKPKPIRKPTVSKSSKNTHQRSKTTKT